ncbi:hypothetical protein [Streptacidiphilus cavernicola]|uniref:Uncharacterized protein n=1 Tax=Streptacidiphilus cavernicola TaxID=3342716 RepID=A0ABV6VNX4_9ACTN
MKITIPRMAAWSSEQQDDTQLRVTRDGLTYADGEQPEDRCDQGFLWPRTGTSPGVGTVQFDRPHPYRQRQAMAELLCQVCFSPATRSNLGVLWLLHDHWGEWPNWPEGMGSTEPPVCADCVYASATGCRSLRQTGIALYWVGQQPLFGVQGKIITRDPLSGKLRAAGSGIYEPTVTLARHVLAMKSVRSLEHCTPVSRSYLRTLLRAGNCSPVARRSA